VDADLLGQHVRQHADPFGMPPGAPVVGAQGGDQHQGRFRRVRRRGAEVSGPGPFRHRGLLAAAGRPPGHLEPGGRPVGERQGEGEQPRQRQEPAGEPLGEDDCDQGRGDQERQPSEGLTDAVGAGQGIGQHPGEDESDDRRGHEDEDTDQAGHPRP
jgi:hypothetical protein